ncbi:hypothetical protein AA0229_1512 [Gluconobacter cerinus NRIC 0229]|nr:hypothetical protein AA0229_1512 [Gluconobacter cerinus NRIC 0229]
MPIPTQQQRVAVKLSYDPLKLHAIDEKHRDRCLDLMEMLEENFLHSVSSGGSG